MLYYSVPLLISVYRYVVRECLEKSRFVSSGSNALFNLSTVILQILFKSSTLVPMEEPLQSNIIDIRQLTNSYTFPKVSNYILISTVELKNKE